MDATNSNTALSSALCEELARSGLRRAVICPGSRSTPYALALERNPAIETTVVLDERSAGFIALGAALASDLPVAVLTTSGSAVANLHPAVVEADEAGVPLILITADRPPELRGTGAGQTIDQIKIFGSAVRWFTEVGTHEADDSGLIHMRSVACRAFATAAGDPRPGPVHLNIALREPLAPTPQPGSVSAKDDLALAGRGVGPLNRVVRARGELDPAVTEEIASRIAASRRPGVLAGMKRNGDRLAHAVTRLAEEAGAPILAEPTSQLRWGAHDRSRIVATYDSIARTADPELIPDLVIRVGEMPTSKPLRQWIGSGGGPTQIVIEPDPAWKEPTKTAEMVVRAAPENLLRDLAERLAVMPERTKWCERWQAADRLVASTIQAELASISSPTEPTLWRTLAQVLAQGDRVFCASSMPIRDLEGFLPCGSAAVKFFSNRGANGIDGQISTAVGIASDALGTTYGVLGDLAFAHDQGALASARAADGLKLIVIDNGGGGIFDFLPIADMLETAEMERLFTTPSGLDVAAVAESHGMQVARPGSTGEFEAALGGGHDLILIEADRAENIALHRRINERVASVLTS
ncbi:MAG: 2-succinyl-5-enolpyruvyl-6-hydroxy-3-cyclohexene-1-carboxylic-acid synthase [bacterium]